MSEKIKFRIEKLDYQEAAVNSVIELLSGIDRHSVSSIYSSARLQTALKGFEGRPEANVRFNAGARLVQNLQGVQYKNGIFKDKSIVGAIPQFTVEMETGTGKTFVYLETILRLWSEFGGQFKKFIIVVPSNAILAGVKKSIETFADYFKPKYNNIDISKRFFVFDKNVSPDAVTAKLIESTDLSIMLITNHSFNKEQNRLRKESESEIVVWNDIKDIAPIIIIDEPQKIDGTNKKKSASLKAIEELDPPMILRYSATHKNLYNPIFRLDSYDAYKQKLVKGIKVTTVHSLTPKNFPYVRYVSFTKELRARIEIFSREQGQAIKCRKFDVDSGASLEELSGGLEQYRDWYIAAQPRKGEDLQISTANGDVLYIPLNKSNDEADPAAAVEKQMEIAIKAHIQKQADILASGKKIKVLTLFFVDSVAKVRGDTEDGRGEYLQIFDRVFERIRSETNLINNGLLQQYPKEFAILDEKVPVTNIREGYFAVDKKNKPVEVEGWSSEVSDEDVSLKAKAQEDVDRGIDLILNKKDELISFDEPLSFIFSHSALREGWDNPNVFVLVTLKEGGSDIAKKQEVGRGLRLPVDVWGVRCKETAINELTVVANDYYDHFAETLQGDYNNSIGFDRNEVSADVIKLTMEKAGIPKEKIEAACDAFRQEIISSGAVKIDRSGKIMLTNKSTDEFAAILFSDPVLIEHSEKIIEQFIKVMQDKGTKKIEISNGDETPFENSVQKYVTEGEFGRMYRKMLAILQKRSIYRYKFDTERFIKTASGEINRQLNKKNDHIKFEITNADVNFSRSRKMQMSNEQLQIEDSTSHRREYAQRPLFELINTVMFNTMLPRLAIIKIINGLSDSSRNKLGDQDHLEEAISIIKKILTEFKSSEFEKAELIEGIGASEKDIFEVDKIADESEIRYLFTPDPSHRRAMNLKYKFDSDGELKFAKALDVDPNVLLYTKLKKGGFVLDTPAGNYSPDWAIVYQDKGRIEMYFIAETKWDKDDDDLNADERIKIQCAKKHFEAVNEGMDEVVKYAWVNAYKDSSKDNSFPEIFIDENYADSPAVDRNL